MTASLANTPNTAETDFRTTILQEPGYESTMKRILAVLAVAVMLLMAGCADVTSNGPEDDLTQDEPSTVNETENGNQTTGETEPEETGNGEENTSTGTDPPGELEIHHIDVGQADAALLVTPANETILVDTGHWQDDGDTVIEYLDAHGVDRVDHLVSTHAHADHIGGHAAVIEYFETERDGIGNIYDSGVTHTTQTYGNYLDAVETHEKELLIVEEGDSLPIEDDAVSADVLNPPGGDKGSDLHNNSIALSIKIGDVTYLTTGDAETDAEQRMVEEWGDELEADIYQAGHHGSSTSSTDPFLEAIDPDVAVISSAYDSQYGHPHDEVLKAFADGNIETYWTGVHGHVVISTDGGAVTAETSVDVTSDAEGLLNEKRDSNETSASQQTLTPAVATPSIAPSALTPIN